MTQHWQAAFRGPHLPAPVIRLSGFVLLCSVLLTTVCLPEEGEDIEETEENAYVLRPLWEPEKRYRWLQRLKAVATVAGLGKQTMEWRQHFHLTATNDDGREALELGIESIRVDFDIAGERSRYYFDAEIPLRYQERKGFPGTLLRNTELFVRNRYTLHSSAEQGQDHTLSVKPVGGGENAPGVKDAWERLPWETLSAAMLHQGIPGDPLKSGASWKHAEQLVIPGHGQARWEFECQFTGFKEYEGRRLALIQFEGMFHGVFHRNTAIEESPGIGIQLPKVRGLTLIDLKRRCIASSVIKLEGKLQSLGLPGTAENETAPVKKTLTLTLLGIDE